MNNSYQIIKTLKNKGFTSYIVGGFVRDKLLYGNQVTVGDIDIATSASPQEVKDIFSKLGDKVIPTGINHGTVTVMVHGLGYEITTFRKDISCDGRNATIEYTNLIEEDLSRRDFTVNSIAYCPLDDKYIDPFDGKKDCANSILRTTGNPFLRFKEDYLRMFRALRLKSVLGFTIEEKTYSAIANLAHTNWDLVVSIERIKAEFDKCFIKAEFPSNMIIDLHSTGLLRKILPEVSDCFGFIQNSYHKHDVFYHTVYTLDAVPKGNPLIRWAALLHDIGKIPSRKLIGEDYTFHNHEKNSGEMANNILKRLKFSNKEIFYITNLVKHHMFQCKNEMTDSAIRRFVSSLGVEYVDDICILKYADRVGNGTKSVTELNIASTKLKTRLKKILEEDVAFKIKDLAITGFDIMELKKIPQSKLIGLYLKQLYEIVLDNPSLNRKEELEKIVLRF